MVKKITSGEYLKRFDNMTAAERLSYIGRVGDWLSVSGQSLTKKGDSFDAQLQNVLQVSVGWNDAECLAFEDGAVLLSALVGVADTKLPELLYAISAKRAIKKMFGLLWEIEATNCPVGKADGLELDARQQVDVLNGFSIDNGSAAPDTKAQNVASVTTASDGKAVHSVSRGGVPVRPRHFDQYVHLLPEKSQDRIAKYGPLMRELDDVREKLRLLMNDSTVSAADREALAKRATAIDKELAAIKKEADSGWDNLVKEGRVVVDDLGNARVVSQDLFPQNEGTKESTELTSEQKQRRAELRKWLTDTRRGNGRSREERVEKWRENFREYFAIEGEAAFKDTKILAAIKHYGIEIDSLKK